MTNLQADTLTLDAPAKLNLRLHINGRRADGYHLLSMLNVCLDFCDQISMQLIPRGSGAVKLCLSYAPDALHPDGATDAILRDSKLNIASCAARHFLERFAPTYDLELRLAKRIPSGAGLGGGSSDAAAVLRALAARFEIDKSALGELALRLGADLPFFLGSGFSYVGGVGEEVRDLEMKQLEGRSCYLVLSPEHLSTQRVFELERQKNRSYQNDNLNFKSISFHSEREIRSLVKNDLELSAFELCPALGKMIKEIRSEQDLVAGMSGSGSALFLFSSEMLPITGCQLERLEQICARYNARLSHTRFRAINAAKFGSRD